MKTAFLYAGQGSQRVGMGLDFYDTYPEFWEAFDNLDTSFDLKSTCFHDPDNQLNDTRFTQPCMLAFAIGVTELLYSRGIRPEYAAGLSLGEYSALYAAGALDAKTAIDLIEFRAQAMSDAASGYESAMAAVLRLDRQQVWEICKKTGSHGFLEVANYNCPGQIVISGSPEAVEFAGTLVKAEGGRCMKLNTSGPFHTSMMLPAAKALKEKLKSISFGDMSAKVLFNCTGGFLNEEQTIASMLERQVYSSVYMEEIIKKLETEGVQRVIEIGPGKVLSGFVRKTAPEITTYSIDTVADFENLIGQLQKEEK